MTNFKRGDRVTVGGIVTTLKERTQHNGYVFPPKGCSEVLDRKFVIGILIDSVNGESIYPPTEGWFYSPASRIDVPNEGPWRYHPSKWMGPRGESVLAISDQIAISGTVETVKSKYGLRLKRVKRL